jgi:hypothetical protein
MEPVDANMPTLVPGQQGRSSPVDPSISAFDRDLPNLLRTHHEQWVAYHSGNRVGFGRSQTELFNRCLQRGLKTEEFIVRFVSRAALADHEELEFPSNQ